MLCLIVTKAWPMHWSVFMSSCLPQDQFRECMALEDCIACKRDVLSCVYFACAPLFTLQLASPLSLLSVQES